MRLVDNTVPFPTPTTVEDAVDALLGLCTRGEVSRVVILYEKPGGEMRWLTSHFDTVNDQLGFVEFQKLCMFRLATEGR